MAETNLDADPDADEDLAAGVCELTSQDVADRISGSEVPTARSGSVVGDADFSNVHFRDDVSFHDVRFLGEAKFDGARFHGCADFTDAEFTDSASFAGAWFRDGCDFSATVFRGRADFSGVRVIAPSGCELEDEESPASRASFTGARFLLNASFARARFPRNLDLSDAEFSGRFSLAGGQALRDVVLTGAAFRSPVVLGPLIAGRRLRLDRALFEQDAQVKASTTMCSCERTRFVGRADLKLRWAGRHRPTSLPLRASAGARPASAGVRLRVRSPARILDLHAAAHPRGGASMAIGGSAPALAVEARPPR